MRASSSHGRLLVVTAALSVLAGASCLPADTRPPPGSVLLTVTSGDAPSVPTVDGWSIAVDRLLIGMGWAGFQDQCGNYNYEGQSYDRLLDATLHSDQKISISYGLGKCNFTFAVTWPDQETVLGEGVTEADRDGMKGLDEPSSRRPSIGISVDFAATATRGTETKWLHWKFRQGTSYTACSPRGDNGGSLPLVLEGDENLPLRTAVRGTVLFADNAPATDSLRFDPMAAADTTLGNDDGEITLEELGKVTIEDARQFGGLYKDPEGSNPRMLVDYLHQVLFERIVEFPDHFGCMARIGMAPQPQ